MSCWILTAFLDAVGMGFEERRNVTVQRNSLIVYMVQTLSNPVLETWGNLDCP